MKTADNTMRRMAALMVVLCATIPLLAATPSDLLDKAVDLFREGKYQQAQEALLEIDREQLPAERRDQRDELMEEITTAVNQSGEAAQDLEDALAAQARKDLNAAEKRFQKVIDNKYASDAQKRKAAEGLALVKKQRDLAGKIQVPQTATRPAGTAASRPADAFRKAREERARIEAALKIKAGEDAAAKGQYDLAEQHFEEALKLVPNHPAAIHGLQLIKQHRSVEGKPNLIDETANRALLRWTRTVSLYQQSEGEIRGLINDRKYDEARRRVADAGQLLDAGRLDASPPSEYEALRRELDGLGQMIDVEEKDVIEEKAIKDRKITLEIERQRERRVEREKMERIGELFNQAEQLKRQKEYEMAAELLREAMAIDPTYERAKWQLEAMEDAGLIDEQVRIREMFLNKMQDALLEADQAKTPKVTGKNDEIFAFPDEERWRLISSRDPYGVDGAGGETEGDRLARKALDTPLPADIQFPQGTTLRQAIDRLKEAGKITINVNWSALGMVGIDPDGTEVGDLSVGGVKLETALEMVLDMAGGTVGDIELGFDVLEGIILVSTTEDLNRKTEVRVYDVRDLLLRIRSLSVDENMGGMGMMGMGGMGMMGMGGMGMGGMGMGGMGMGGMGMGGMGMGGGYGSGGGGGYGSGSGSDDEEEDDEDREEQIENLKELIQKLVEPGTWEEEGGGDIGSLDVWNDRLIVRHTRSAHRQIRDLFKQLREAKDLQVAVEARFITLTNNFLEEIGVDLDIILNQGNAGLDQSIIPSTGGTGGYQQAVNPITGMGLLQSRQQTQYGFLPAPVSAGVPLTQQGGYVQPFGAAGLVPAGSPQNWWDNHTTAVPLLNSTMGLASPRATGIPGGYGAQAYPAFSMFGSFMDNIQVDFLLKATQLDSRSSLVDAPRLTVYSGRRAEIQVSTSSYFVSAPGQLPVGGTGINGQGATGRPPQVSMAPSGRTFQVTPTVSGDRKYVTMELVPTVYASELQDVVDSTGPMKLPNISTTSIATTVTVPDRGWLLLGGLKQAGETEVEAGVPILSKIPILKRAYTNRSRVKDERTLLLLVKPTIIIQGEIEEEAFPNLVTVNQGGAGG